MKKLFRNILCPIDFDDNSTVALQLACDLAEEPSAQIQLLHVVQPPVFVPEAGVALDAIPDEHSSRIKLQELATRYLDNKVPYKVFAKTGDPAHVILAAITELGVDSVVMATHGRKGVTRLLLGSVAERVVRESPRPVLTVRVTADA